METKTQKYTRLANELLAPIYKSRYCTPNLTIAQAQVYATLALVSATEEQNRILAKLEKK